MSNWDGFYPDHECKQCGKALGGTKHGPGSYGRPAELYAGTYTGLCYTCQNKNDYVLYIYPLDNAQQISAPPHCPNWRRDRELYIAYADCSDCKGKGRKMISRSFANGGPYPQYCKTCFDRFYNHPLRKAKSAYLLHNTSRIHNAAESMWQTYLRKTLKIPKRYNWKTDPKNISDQAKALLDGDYARDLYERAQNLKNKVRDKANLLYPDPTVKPTA
jgi:hypothetical protein